MPYRTLDEYLKQTTPTSTKQPATKPKYKITGFYKETPIGEIPKEWRVVKIRELAIFMKRGKAPKYGNSNVIVIKTAHNYPGGIRFEEAPHASPSFAEKLPLEYYLKPGDILINSTGTGSVGRVGFFRGCTQPCTVDSHITILRINHNIILPEFVFYYLSSPMGFKALVSRATGSTNQIELYVSAIGSLQIPLPPLAEQWGIAEVLSALDRAIEATERLIKRLERFKRGLMQELLTKGIGHKEYKQTPIGKIPKEWKVVKLGDVTKIDTKAVTPKPGVKYYYIGLEDIESNTGRLLKHPEDLTDGSEIRSTKYSFTANHVLYGKLRPYLNKVALPSRDGICSTDILPILPNTRVILREYLAYVLLHPRFVSYATARMRGTNHPRVNPREILRYEFPLPPIDEQKIIVETLSALSQWIDAEKKRREKFERLKRDLMELLLTGRVRVRVERLDGEENSSGSDGGAGS